MIKTLFNEMKITSSLESRRVARKFIGVHKNSANALLYQDRLEVEPTIYLGHRLFEFLKFLLFHEFGRGVGKCIMSYPLKSD